MFAGYTLNVPTTPPTEFVKLIVAYVQLRESRKMLKGNCPFHDDNSGSFMVYPSKEIFKCPDDRIKAIAQLRQKSRTRPRVNNHLPPFRFSMDIFTANFSKVKIWFEA